MPQDLDPTELLALQTKAYGRDGGLTEAEAARLRELEAPASGLEPVAEPEQLLEAPSAGSVPAAHAPVTPSVPPEGDADTVRVEPDESIDETSVGDNPSSSLPETLRRSWKAVAVASVLLVAIGIGAGWALFAPRAHDIALSDEEVQRRVELSQSGLYDDGSLRAVARDEDALAWYATQDQGNTRCVILDVDELSQAGCGEVGDTVRGAWGVSASVMTPSVAADDDVVTQASVNAVLMLSTTGEPMVAIQRFENMSSPADWFEGEERIRADELVDEGFDANISLVGYFRDVPVWVADRYDDDGQYVSCLIVDAADSQTCAPPGTDGSFDDMSVSGEGDGDTWTATLIYSEWGNRYLTITESPRSATTVVIDTETGDPIEVKSPLTDPDG